MGELNTSEIMRGISVLWHGINALFQERGIPGKTPKALLKEIEGNSFLQKMEKGKDLCVRSKYIEGRDEALLRAEQGAEEAMGIVQEGLIQLGLLDISREKEAFKFGLYGDKTIAAVRKLQETAGISYKDPLRPPDGQLFGPETLAALKKALSAAAEGRNWKIAVKLK